MDVEWMRDRLRDFDHKLAGYAARQTGGMVTSGHDTLWSEIRRAEPTVRKILTALDPKLAEEFDLGGMAGDLQAHGLVQQALGILDDRDEWAAHLRPDAPTLPADEFHPWVWEAAQTLWASEHYRAAVNAAATAINAHTQNKVGRRDVANDDLMNQVFTEKPRPGQVYLRLPGDPSTDQTLKSLNNALRPYAAGCFAGIRNPASHEHGDDWDQQKALEYLASLSVLARWIDECEVRRD